MPYLLLKSVHMSAAAASFTLFALRGVWMIAGSPRRHARWARVVPHVVDSILLASALGLAATLGQWPIAVDWLTVKVLLLALYIALGAVALREPSTAPRARRIACFGAALLVFLAIVSVARAHDPWGALAPLWR